MSENHNDHNHNVNKIKSLKEFKAPVFKEDELVVYVHPYNFHSQKVLLLLYEKNIDFTPYVVDLLNGEQYSEWFLNLNPKADVPVLQDGSIVVPDSVHIINYVENKFHGGDYKTLKPKRGNKLEDEKMQVYDQILSRLPVGALSLGSFIHDDLKLVPKPPFIGPIRKTCLKNNERVHELLKESIDRVEDHKMALLRKLDLQERRKRLVYSRLEYQKILDAIQNVLRFIEDDMNANSHREWLVSNDFSMIDVCFGLLLLRLYQLGFENYYWSYGKLPRIESYFLRFKKRPSYDKLMPSNFEILKDIWQMTPSNYIIGAGAGVLGMAVFAAFAHK
ncbi:ganglioside-induced differentiation-associated protein 1 [Musca domestica]|uniref:Ganglioside-induced differentiation-associated protein 1 n=1 Tax=Musca domestica TaxID=7370 RepID=T1PBG1_MUSDO|nr:ganglioside-induced differentiation-associated protein 1 [Musca domestica]